jgi:beta-mannosidase
VPAALGRRARVEGQVELPLDQGWEATATAPDIAPAAAELDGLDWLEARVPGTAAAALAAAGLAHEGRDLDAEDWWFRTGFEAEPPAGDEQLILRLDGIATVAEVFVNGEPVLESESMFAAHAVDIGHLVGASNELAIRCRALAPLLRERRRPRARWRTRVVSEQNLRFFRTTLLGRAPGFAPGPAAVGPWRPVSLELRRGLALEGLRLRPRLVGGDGALAIRAHLRALDGDQPTEVEVELHGPSGAGRVRLELSGDAGGAVAEGVLELKNVAPWWPHTHGEPALYEARLHVSRPSGPLTIDAGRVGFRTLAPGRTENHDPEADGLDLHLNGVRVFARGAVWMPVDPIAYAPTVDDLRAALESVRDGGMNIVRIPGTAAYESDAFHDLCDELGLLIWQDFMFANLDYPIADERFRTAVEREAGQVMDSLAGRPSLAVLCGNSEVEQQAAMFGVDPASGRGELFDQLLPATAQAAGADAVYLPSAPCGGDLPFRTDRGVANYFGVGAYLRPLEDARRAGVRFASECLAFANVPDERAVEELLGPPPADTTVGGPRWKSGVPRDVGSGWDFDDVRDHYLGLLFGLDPTELRSVDPRRYLELSRAVSGELMAEVFGEWRRASSPCGGGIVLWLRDLVAGAGWGLFDHRGEPKVAYHHLRRALAPVAVWTTDEGLGGVVAHVANDGSEPLDARLRVGLYRDFERRVDEAQERIELPAHGACEHNLEALLGRFVDASWAYRFGPPAQDLIVVSLERDRDGDPQLLSQALRFPAGRPTATEPAARLGLEAAANPLDDGTVRLLAASTRLAYGVRIHCPGFDADDDAFSIEPGGTRQVILRPRGADSEFDGAGLTALNLDGTIRIAATDGG